MAPKFPADRKPENRGDDADAGTDGLTNPSDFERLIALHRALSEADKNLARIIDEAGEAVAAERQRDEPPTSP